MKAPLAAALVLVASPVLAQPQDFSKVEIKTEKVTEGLYVLFGSGGNIGLSVGKSGTFVIDDQFAPLTDKILAAIHAITPDSVRFVVNTHWPFDHTGGNENLGKAGALLVAHESVRRRMSTDQFMALFDRDMLKTLRDRVAALKGAGKTRDEVVAAKVTADHDARWATDFMKGDVFAGILYDSLK